MRQMKQMLKKGTVLLLSTAMTLSTTFAGNITAFAGGGPTPPTPPVVGADLKVTVTKTTAVSIVEKTYDWTIDKTVDNTTLNLLEGATGTSIYTVTATKSPKKFKFVVEGDISIENKGNASATNVVVDAALRSTNGATRYEAVGSTVTGGPADGILLAGATYTYHYKMYYDSTVNPNTIGGNLKVDAIITGLNIARIRPNVSSPNINLVVIPVATNDSITVVDNNATATVSDDFSHMFTDSGTWGYSKTFNGSQPGTYTNTASASVLRAGIPTTISDTATVTVTKVNSAPNAVNDIATTDEDTAVDINVLANDTDVNGDTLSVIGTVAPGHGTVEINANGTIKYTPNANWNGTDSFAYTISDGKRGTDTAVVTVTVNAVNDAPDAVNDTATTNEDHAVDINVLANDTDVEGNALTVTGTTAPSNGIVAINANGTIKYTPNANWHGTDTFTYTISDGNGAADTATVTVRVNSVNDTPDAVNDSATTNEDTAVNVNVLANDTDADGNTLTVTSVTAPAHGTAVINPDKTVKYTPNANWNGTDTFTYTISDGHRGTDTATVTVTVSPVQDVPDAVNDSASTGEDTSVKISVLSNDIDVDGDALSIVNASNPAHGRTTVNHDGTITYKPDWNWHGTDTFTYRISDGHGGTDTATVTVTVTSVNDKPIALDDLSFTNEDNAVKVYVLFNDFDIEHDTLSIISATNPSHGTAVINADKTITYTPNANWFGIDSFKYTISDGNGGTDTATVRIVVWSVNDKPNAVDDSVVTDEDVSVNISVLSNDTDADGDTLSVTNVTDPGHGTVVINADKTVTYTPNANWNGTDTFTYTISDRHHATDTATVTVTVNAINDAPDAVNDTAETDEDVAVKIDVLANDTDIDGDVLTITGASAPGHGTAVVNSDGTITYTPEANWFGTDTFTYEITDAQQQVERRLQVEGEQIHTDTATVTVIVKPVNDAPVAVDDDATTAEDTAVKISVLANDSDIDEDVISVISATIPVHGIAVVNADGTITYTPNANWNGSDTFEYTISDGKGGTDTAMVTVKVDPVNDAPKANDSSIKTDEDTAVNGTVTGSDIDGDTLTFVLEKAPEHGKVTLNSNGTYTYTPNADYNGTDKFTFMSNDGKANSQPATVTITINAVDDLLIPKTGEDTPYALYGFAALSMLAGIVLLIAKRRKQNQ